MHRWPLANKPVKKKGSIKDSLKPMQKKKGGGTRKLKGMKAAMEYKLGKDRRE